MKVSTKFTVDTIIRYL